MVILINEPETFFLKLLQILLDDESWSLKDNVFNKNKNLFNPKPLDFKHGYCSTFYLKIN